ncbi:MAG: ROK family transcriptional regulator [Lentisphaerales bacterium]|nr:ROK family transcriptional regulator [Lentisphaerales bacterium]
MNTTDTIHSEQTRKRAENRYAILRTLQSVQPMKRTEVADYCGIRKSSVTSLVEELMEKRWIRLEDESRPRSPLVINENFWRIVSIQLDPGKITTSLINLQGKIQSTNILKDKSLSTKDGYLKAIIKCASKEIKNKKNIFGLALSIPGMIEPETGICINSINLPEFENIPLLELLQEKFNCPIVVENDVRASLYSSLFLEARNTAIESAIYIDVTSGVGSTLMVNGKPFSGAHGTAGEIGHLVAGNSGRICRCGQRDCLETYSSIPAICNDINEKLGLDLNSSLDIIDNIEKHPQIQEILDEACEHLAIPLSSMISFTDPEVIILGNQSRAFYKLLIPALKKAISKRQNGPSTRELSIEIGPEHSSIRGAAALLMDNVFKQP